MRVVDGRVDFDSWDFYAAEMAGTDGLSVAPTPEGMAGWSLSELHAIAHGHPCGCGAPELGQ